MVFDKDHDGKDSNEGEDYSDYEPSDSLFVVDTPSVAENIRDPLQSRITNMFRFFSKTKQDQKEEGSSQNDTPTAATSTVTKLGGDGHKSGYTTSKGKQNVHTIGTSSSLTQSDHSNLDSASVTHIGEKVSPSCLGTWYSACGTSLQFMVFYFCHLLRLADPSIVTFMQTSEYDNSYHSNSLKKESISDTIARNIGIRSNNETNTRIDDHRREVSQ